MLVIIYNAYNCRKSLQPTTVVPNSSKIIKRARKMMRSGLSIKKSFPSKVLKTEASFELLNYYFLRLFESFQVFFNLKKYF